VEGSAQRDSHLRWPVNSPPTRQLLFSFPFSITPVVLPVLLVVTLAVYFPTLQNGFVWDDWQDVVHNPSIQSLTPFETLFASASNTSRPAVLISFAADYALWNKQAFGYHLTNLLLHLVNVWLLYRVASLLLSGRGAAVLAALWFAIFPLNGEAVHSISLGRSYLLVGAVGLASLLLFVGTLAGRRHQALGLTGVAIGFLLALASSEWALMLPAVLIMVALALLLTRLVDEGGGTQSDSPAAWPLSMVWTRWFVISGGLVFLGSVWWIGSRVPWQQLAWSEVLLTSLPIVKGLQLLVFPVSINLWYSLLPFGADQVSVHIC